MTSSPPWLIAGACAAMGYGGLALASRSAGGVSLELFWLCAGFAFAATVLAWRSHGRLATEPPVAGILAFAALFQILGLFGEPILEDDPYRYLWDGWVFSTFGSPYGVLPSAFFESDSVPAAVDAALGRINNPDLPTIYGPVCEWIFLAAYRIAPGQLWPLQLAAGVAAVGCVAALTPLAKPRFLMLFAWSPLLVKEFGFTAHTDVYALLPLLLALQTRSKWMAGLLLGLAIGARPFPLLVAPLILRGAPSGWLAFVGVAAGLTLPFSSSIVGNPSYAEMATGWLFNAPLHLLGQIVLPSGHGRWLLAAAFLAYWTWLVARSLRREANADVLAAGAPIFGAFLIAAPVFNPWYAVWPMAFATVRPRAWVWVGSLSVLAAYAHGLHLSNPALEPYEIPAWALAIEFVPIALALAWETRAARTPPAQLSRRSE